MFQRLCLSLARWGLVLSAAAHAVAGLGVGLPWALVMGLHGGVLVLALPALGAARAVHPGRHTAWLRTGLLAGRPLWLQGLVAALFVYAAANGCLALGGLLGHLEGVARLDAPAPSGLVRVFSGFWLFLYALDVAAFYPGLHPLVEEPHAHGCPFGHAVPPGVEFCPRCGWRVERD